MQQYAETRRTALLERAAELDEYIQALQSIYKRSGQDGSGDALGLLSGYPEHLRQRCEKQQQDSAEDWEQAGHGYTTFTKELNEVSALVTLLFDSPENSNVPRMLLDAVQDACRRLELPQNKPVIALASPGQFETYPESLHKVLYSLKNTPSPEIGMSGDAPDKGRDQFAVMIAPRWEMTSARWWPIALGHELAHLKIHQLLPEGLGGTTRDPLATLNLKDDFPWDEIGEANLRAGNTGPFVDEPNLDGLQTAGDTGKTATHLQQSQADRTAQDTDTWLVANNWLAELVCDAYMVMEFGPAAVAAMADFLWANGWESTDSYTHPCGNFRVQFMLEVLETTADNPLLNLVVEPWRQAVKSWVEDQQFISQVSPNWFHIVRQFLLVKRPAIVDLVTSWTTRYDPYQGDQCRALIAAQRQLSVGLPPNGLLGDSFPPGVAEGSTSSASKQVSSSAPKAGSATAADSQTPSAAPALPSITNADVLNAAWAVSRTCARKDDGQLMIPVDRLAAKAIATTGEKQIDVPPTSGVHHIEGTPTGVLTGDGIKQRLHPSTPLWHRLVITPLFANSVGTAAVDIRLGRQFITFRRSGTPVLNATQRGADPRTVQQRVQKGVNDPFILHPGELVLAATLEYLAMPVDLSAQVITRSSYGRLGAGVDYRDCGAGSPAVPRLSHVGACESWDGADRVAPR